jgi:twitching motility two-component system response regulator PilG
LIKKAESREVAVSNVSGTALSTARFCAIAACFSHAGNPFLYAGSRGFEVDDTKQGSLTGVKVMVIDDSKTIRRTAETLLRKEGCEVVTATDGFEALAKISDQQPQIIFVDIMMPRLDGYQTCALIKNNQMFKGTPVIMLSSKDGLFDKARGRIVGSEQYLTKPFTREELLGAIRRHVQ